MVLIRQRYGLTIDRWEAWALRHILTDCAWSGTRRRGSIDRMSEDHTQEAVMKAMHQFERVGCEKCGSKQPKEGGWSPAEYFQTGKDVYVECRCGHRNMMSSRHLD